MGIDIDGGMIVGCDVDEINYDQEQFECSWDFADEHNMSIYSRWYDADEGGQFIGFTVPNISPSKEDFTEWVSDVNQLALKFEEITGVEAQLVGMQNVW